MYEENGLTVSELKLCGIKDWIRDNRTRYIVHLYKTNKFHGEITSSDEGEVWWVPLSALPNMNLSNSMYSMLKLFCDDNFIEQFFYKKDGKWIEILK